MRRVLASAFGLATSVVFTFGAGCTFLVPFEDAPTEAGLDSRSPRPRDASVPQPADAAVDEGATPPSSGNCDPFPRIDEVGGCMGIQENGQICADSQVLKFPDGYDPAAFVVTCSKANGGRAICVKECFGPGKCAHLPDGFPDVCDQCSGRSGRFCGNEMAGWPPVNYGLLVTCEGDRLAAVEPCKGGCTPVDGGQARCGK